MKMKMSPRPVLRLLRRFWWVLALIAIGGYLWLRGRLREARRADALREYLAIEKRTRVEYEAIGARSRAARLKLQKEIEAAQHAWMIKRKEFEDATATDRRSLEVYWGRAFGSSDSVRSERE